MTKRMTREAGKQLARPEEPCDNCPWRKDAPRRHWHAGEFLDVAGTMGQNFGPMMGCHKSKDGAPLVCSGYLLTEGTNNFNVRLALSQEKLTLPKNPRKLPLFSSFRAMCRANGVPKKLVEEALAGGDASPEWRERLQAALDKSAEQGNKP